MAPVNNVKDATKRRVNNLSNNYFPRQTTNINRRNVHKPKIMLKDKYITYMEVFHLPDNMLMYI